MELGRLNNILVAAPAVCAEVTDQPIWSASTHGVLKVTDLQKFAVGNDGATLITTKLTWLKYVPPKVQVLGWFAWKGRIKIREFLQKLGVISPNDPTTCVFCNSGSELVNHVLIWCPYVWKIWARMLKWWDIQSALPWTVESLLLWWVGGKLKKKEMMIWGAIPLAVIWSVWRCRNDYVFRAKVPNEEDLYVGVVLVHTDFSGVCSAHGGYSQRNLPICSLLYFSSL
ncbi:uncharacterized protein LOC114316486 [Camellia sinensis]|uniref:uncharacterized protein LOC114316486 n=1 Tax=Camellia sinensis TaxID=4442 RepID=UPI0010367965|nr:uncharacterized protein LOC114316486 [Camellia sinensis]